MALTGDFVHAGFQFVDAIATLVAKFQAPMGVYAVLGNHDYSVRNIRGVRRYPRLPDAVAEALRERGIDVLKNEHRLVDRDGAQLAVAGVADWWSREADSQGALAGLSADTPRIVLAHNPRTIEQVGAERCDLMLSGHTHGGQIQFAKLGRPLLSRKMQDFAAGLYFHETGYLYVNKGIGYTVRFRYQVRPEIAVFRLRRLEDSGKLDSLYAP